MSDMAMIESSMILHKDSLYQLMDEDSNGGYENLVISDALFRMSEDIEMMISILGRHLEISEDLIDRDAITHFMRNVAGERIPRHINQNSYEHEIYQNLIENTGNEWITQIFFEEWEFLTTNSWLFSKTRKAIDDIVEAGANAYQTSKLKFEQMTRKLLNKEPGETLSPNDKVKAGAKWVAMGGGPVLALFEPISGTALTTTGSIFILSDP